MSKVLWLASWYPNESDPFSGDFIKRQAEAVATYQPLNIVYVGKFEPKFDDKRIENKIAASKRGNLNENIFYYSDPKNISSFFPKIRSLSEYLKKHLAYIRILKKNNEMPDLVHVQIAMKAGLIALYVKWKYKIPYLVTEHWSGYYPQSKDSLFHKSFVEKYLTKLILKKATVLLPVSEALGKQIDEHWTHVPYRKIPNVVDTNFFYPSKNKTTNRFRFIHISSLLYPKNPEGIIKVFNQLSLSKFDVELVLVGPMNSSVAKLLTGENKIGERIITTGEVSYEQVGVELRKADALVMFSDYENMPCAILEALCTGIPVIATRVGGIPEVVNKENGILINAGNEHELLEAMKKMIEGYQEFDKTEISQLASDLFSYNTIGKEITAVYNSILKKHDQV